MISHGGYLRKVEKKIAFRTDASDQIGTGHFMRCLTLADALKQYGAHIRFISRNLPDHLHTMLLNKGHECLMLNNFENNYRFNVLEHKLNLGVCQEQDAVDTIKLVSNEKWDWIVVDHYALDASWEKSLRKVVKNLMVIDDLADRDHDCNVLLDQNFYIDMNSRYIDKVPAHCRLLLGPRYALLREEFCKLHDQVKPRTKALGRILVFFGGVDIDNYTGNAIEALSDLGIENLCVDVVIGTLHPFRDEIKSACEKYKFDFHLQTDRIGELMAAADLAIGAGGSSTWERCCVGLPTFAICTAFNQIHQIADAASEGLLYVPEIKDDLTQAIKRHTGTLLENSFLRQALSRKSMQIVDGRGVFRVIGNLIHNCIKIRIACQDDMEQLFEWRNHPTIREASRTQKVINWEEHKNWFAKVLLSSDKKLLICSHDGVTVGVVRFDIQSDAAEVSIYLDPNIKESGLGHDVLLNAECWLAANRPEIFKVRAEVLMNNKKSQHFFLEASYKAEITRYSKRIRV